MVGFAVQEEPLYSSVEALGVPPNLTAAVCVPPPALAKEALFKFPPADQVYPEYSSAVSYTHLTLPTIYSV